VAPAPRSRSTSKRCLDGLSSSLLALCRRGLAVRSDVVRIRTRSSPVPSRWPVPASLGDETSRARPAFARLLADARTFIKLGQLLSTRPDILPPEYIEVLSQLQDDVPPADWDETKATIEADLGPVEERFDEFDTDPISGASLGQVYRATVDGQDVAVKIQRPGIQGLVQADLRVIMWSLPILMWFVGEARSFSLQNLADEFDKTIREEMDYGREREMLEEIRANFAETEGVTVPPAIDSHCSPRVLTMEYRSGTKINDIEALDAEEIDRTAVATTLQRAYLQMIVDDGVFHADPHPGNLAVQSDGTIVFYDFGMSGRVDDFIQEKIVDFYAAVASQDIDAILDALVEMGTLSANADRAVMSEVLELAIADARGEDIEQYRVQQIIGQIEDSIYEFPFRLPKNLALVLRVATVVEGVCVTLDPNFDFITIATDYIAEEGYREETVKRYLDTAREDVQQSIRSTIQTPPKLERALDRIERENFHLRADIEDSDRLLDTFAKRIVLGMIATGGVASTAFLHAESTLTPTVVCAVFTLCTFLLLYRSFRTRSNISAQPQFTRQNLRERDRKYD
jgi:predicted unusual protein kinase regulating ubiquinone biosynthesis (AarF/ABC1/UbiB family)